MNPCSIHYTPLPLVEKRQGSVMERARAEWQTGPPCGHGVVLGSPAVAEVVAGPVPRAWPCAWRAGWAVGPRGLLRSWVTSCCSGSGSRGEGGGRRGFLQGAEPEGLLEVGPAVFEDSVLVPAESLVSLWNSLCVCVCVCVCISPFQRFVTPWTVVRQALLSTGFSRQEYCSGLPRPSLRDLSDLGIEPMSPVSPALQADSLPAEPSLEFTTRCFKWAMLLGNKVTGSPEASS